MRGWMVGLILVGCSGSDPDTDPGGDTDPPGTSCEGVAESACAEVEGCVGIQGTPINGNQQFAGCAVGPGGCLDVESAATDPSGDCWDFPDSCIPDGWTPISGTCLENL